MIYSISGLLRQVAPTYCVVEACGVGYQCSASTHTLSSLPGRGQEVTLLTHLWVKEDGMELFGFSTEQERRCFRMLIGVSGVGPRVALAILSDSAPDRLMLSIAAGDAKALTRAQGVGAKLAQRIILELRDKVSDEDISMPFSDEIGTISTVAETIHNTAKSEAISALVALGYGQTDAAAVIAPMEELRPAYGGFAAGLRPPGPAPTTNYSQREEITPCSIEANSRNTRWTWKTALSPRR